MKLLLERWRQYLNKNIDTCILESVGRGTSFEQVIREETLDIVNEIATGNFDDADTLDSINLARRSIYDSHAGDARAIADNLVNNLNKDRVDDKPSQYETFLSILNHNLNGAGMAIMFKQMGMDRAAREHLQSVRTLIHLLGLSGKEETFENIVIKMGAIGALDTWKNALDVLGPGPAE